MAAKRKTKAKQLDKRQRVKEMARERIGTVKPARLIETDKDRKKPKHKKPISNESNGLEG